MKRASNDAGARTIAVLVSCFSEAAAIAGVVREFRAALPDAEILVFDNNSTDETAAISREVGAEVRRVLLQGKDHVVRRMFADVEADAYVLVDSDGNYDASIAPDMIRRLFDDRLDGVVGVREAEHGAAYRPEHAFGNRLITGFLRRLVGGNSADILPGYRVFSRRCAKSFPVLSGGFEIETELTVHALELRLPIAECAATYRVRIEGSQSRLRSVRDGLRILWMMARLFSAERPLVFYSLVSVVLGMLAVVLAVPVVLTYVNTGLVPRFPTTLLSTGLMLIATLSVYAGLLLDTVTRGRRELRLPHYLALRAPQ